MVFLDECSEGDALLELILFGLNYTVVQFNTVREILSLFGRAVCRVFKPRKANARVCHMYGTVQYTVSVPVISFSAKCTWAPYLVMAR